MNLEVSLHVSSLFNFTTMYSAKAEAIIVIVCNDMNMKQDISVLHASWSVAAMEQLT